MRIREKVRDTKQKTPKKGLSDNEVTESRKKHGSNELTKKRGKSFLQAFLANLGDPVIRILLLALGVNLIFVFWGGDIIETIGIAISVLLATLISTLSERGSESAFKKLSEECAEKSARVYRNGRLCILPISEIVVGDVLLVGAGDFIAADGYVISGRIGVDQSAMTGEGKEIEKLPSSDRDTSPNAKSTALRGCSVLSGEAEIEIFAVGDKTFLGKISGEIQTDTRKSPLKIRLEVLAKQISRLGYIAAFFIGAAYLFNNFIIDSGGSTELILMKLRDIPYLLENLLHAFMLGLTVIVVAVPEGLPMMIAVVLSSNIRRMIKDNVLVRKAVGIEAAGSMNILFTDKTGTLTEGKMSVGKIILPDGKEFDGYASLKESSPMLAELYRISCVYNSASRMSEGELIGGNATDRALLSSVSDAAAQSEGSISAVASLPFDSSNKYSAVRLSGASCGVMIKGAAEKLIPHVRYAYASNGSRIAFPTVSYELLRQIGRLTSDGGRVLIIAESDRMPDGDRFGDLTLICAVLLTDRQRPEARPSVKELQGAGIQVVMITGDSKDTAASIAKDTGIITKGNNIVLTGEELAALSDDTLKKLLPRLSVVARALPSDKSRLVRVAQEQELVVGMTGDGINDAPALKLADIGFSMGNGTHVAREAGDIIILDNNLSSIAKAVLYGRNIFKSIRKFITLQLTMNFCAVGVSMIGPFVGIDAPVTVVQMLWINIIMDTLGGLAFAGEAPLPSCMKERPKKRDEPILNRYMINQIAVLGGATVALCMAFLLTPAISSRFRASEGNICLLTAFFAFFIFTSVFNCFNARTDRLKIFSGLSKNKIFVLIMLLVSFVQILFVYLGGSVLRTIPLTVSELCFTLLLSLSVFPIEILRKLIWRLRGKKEGF